MNTSLNFTIDEIKALNESVNTTKDEINATINSIEACLNELEGNITGTAVNSSINSISNSIDKVNTKMVGAFQQLSDFLNSQMKNYGTTVQNAGTDLKKVLDFINNNF